MATTKAKESIPIKEKNGTSLSVSQTNNGKRIIKQSKPVASSGKETSIESKKPLPNYLKPTFSSIHDPLKQVKKHGPEDPSDKPNPIRRRSFDKPPSASRAQKNPHISPGPRMRVPVKPSTSTPRTTTAPRPHSEKTVKTCSNGTKAQPLHTNIVKRNNVASKKGPTAWVAKKEVSHSNPGSKQTSPKSERKKVEEESLVHEVDKCGEVVKSDTNVEHEEIKPVETANEQLSAVVDNAPQLVETKVEDNEGKDDHQILEEDDHNKEVGSVMQQDEDSAVDTDAKMNEYNVEEESNIPAKNVDLETKFENEDKPHVENCDHAEIKDEKQMDDVIEEQKHEATNVSKGPSGQKKDSPPYNDVIEETASKLMEKRQNKVLALAGAFQSVIDTETTSK